MELCTNVDSLPRKKLEMLEKVSKIVFSSLKSVSKDMVKRNKITSKKVSQFICLISIL